MQEGEELMILDWKPSRTIRAFIARAVRCRTRFVTAVATALALAVPARAILLNAHAPRAPTSSPL